MFALFSASEAPFLRLSFIISLSTCINHINTFLKSGSSGMRRRPWHRHLRCRRCRRSLRWGLDWAFGHQPPRTVGRRVRIPPESEPCWVSTRQGSTSLPASELPAAGVGEGLTLAHLLRPHDPRPLLRAARAVGLGCPTQILDI